MKTFLLIVLCVIGYSESSIQQCSCDQILTEADCLMSQLQCNWNSFKKQCQYETSNAQPQQLSATYCNQFSKDNCNKLRPCETCVTNGPCQWYQEKCSHFTGCTAFIGKINSMCQYISERCITDGIHCVEIGICDSYKTEIACEQDMNQKWCFWDMNTVKCRYPQKCEELPKTFTSSSQCNSQISGCISNGSGCYLYVVSSNALYLDVSAQGGGVTTIATSTKHQCKDFTTNSECVTNYQGNPCLWNDNLCVDKICSNAPKTFTTNIECQQFLSYCITMNGGGCMNNGTCQVANISQACIKDISGVDCFWSAIGECIYKSCDLAPSTLTSNQDCDSFFKDKCTVKEGGGCRNKECEELSGSSHKSCKTQLKGCTVGLDSKCAKIKNCEDTTLKGACIEGLNGPCLWIMDKVSNEQSQGKCYSYNSCQSLQWNTDQQCKQISNMCTTDGTKCVPITSCSETNINGGCVTGNDGLCIQSLTAINQTTKVCKLFESCSSVQYLKHQECQQANQKCTSDGVTGCIELVDCTAYKTKESCKMNNDYIPCFWNQVQGACRDSICSDYNYQTHQQCYSIDNNLKQMCTSDGVQCLAIESCTSYKQKQVCNNAKATEGSCIWMEADKSCLVKQCTDISTPSLTNCSLELGNCTFDGFVCIQWQLCSNYLTKIACNTSGLDGICQWSKSDKCQLMTSCQSNTEDEQACLQANQKCYWTTSGKCLDHTCQSYYTKHGTCKNIKSWDNKSQTICQEDQGKCKSVDPTTLNQLDCYKISEYTYTWNPNSSKCSVCNSIKKSNSNNNKSNSSNSSKNNSNSKNDTSGNNDTDSNSSTTQSSLFITSFMLFILIILI